MAAKVSQGFQLLTWIDSEKISSKRSSSVQFSQRLGQKQKVQFFIRHLHRKSTVASNFSCSFKTSPESLVVTLLRKLGVFSNDAGDKFTPSYDTSRVISSEELIAAVLKSGSFHAPSDEAVILKNKSQEIVPYLNGRCIYLVGMMGSGKTTVGKVLSQVLHYSFSDCDTIIEEEVGTSVTDMFTLNGEVFSEIRRLTEALRKLSMMHHLVVSTGGGAVIRPINWKYMQNGITVWLDVPLEALAQRIAAVGTNSRPLLHHDSGDAYSKALTRLTNLLEERGEAYANANARVSLENIGAKLGIRNVLNLSPTAIAIEALEQIEGFVKRENDYYAF